MDVIVTTFNKGSSIGACLQRLIATLEETGREFRVIVADDASEDESVARIQAINDHRINILTSSQNLGKGAQIKRAVQFTDAELIGIFDGDLDIHPRSLVEAAAVLECSTAAAVVGSKPHPDSVVIYPRSRRILSVFFRLICAMFFNLKVRDTQTGMKVFRGNVLRDVVLETKSTGFIFDLELVARCTRRGYSVVEVPVTIDFDFSSSISLWSIATMLRDILRVKILLAKSGSAIRPES